MLKRVIVGLVVAGLAVGVAPAAAIGAQLSGPDTYASADAPSATEATPQSDLSDRTVLPLALWAGSGVVGLGAGLVVLNAMSRRHRADPGTVRTRSVSLPA